MIRKPRRSIESISVQTESINWYPKTWSEVEANLATSIHKKAAQYCDREYNHFALNCEDLIAEGWIVYAEFLVDPKNKELEPANYWAKFQRSLSNHINQLFSYHKYADKRQMKNDADEQIYAYVDLSEVADFMCADEVSEVFYKEYVDEVISIIATDPELYELFMIMVDIPAEIEAIVWQEQLRKRALARQGRQSVRYLDVVAPRNSHFRKFLGWDYPKFNQTLNRLQVVVKSVLKMYSKETFTTKGQPIKINQRDEDLQSANGYVCWAGQRFI